MSTIMNSADETRKAKERLRGQKRRKEEKEKVKQLSPESKARIEEAKRKKERLKKQKQRARLQKKEISAETKEKERIRSQKRRQEEKEKVKQLSPESKAHFEEAKRKKERTKKQKQRARPKNQQVSKKRVTFSDTTMFGKMFGSTPKASTKRAPLLTPQEQQKQEALEIVSTSRKKRLEAKNKRSKNRQSLEQLASKSIGESNQRRQRDHEATLQQRQRDHDAEMAQIQLLRDLLRHDEQENQREDEEDQREDQVNALILQIFGDHQDPDEIRRLVFDNDGSDDDEGANDDDEGAQDDGEEEDNEEDDDDDEGAQDDGVEEDSEEEDGEDDDLDHDEEMIAWKAMSVEDIKKKLTERKISRMEEEKLYYLFNHFNSLELIADKPSGVLTNGQLKAFLKAVGRMDGSTVKFQLVEAVQQALLAYYEPEEEVFG